LPEPPRFRPDGGQDPPERDDKDSANTEPLDISEMDTAYLVPPEPLQELRASREEQMVAHQAAADHLRSQQRAVVSQVLDWQDIMYAERSTDWCAQIEQQIANLWATWSELERQSVAHGQAVRALLQPDPPPPTEEQGG
jgi:hypothetical protein